MESLQNRLKERRRKARLRIFTVLACIAGIIGLCIGAWKLVHRPGMAFGEIAIQGTNKIKAEDVVRMANSQMPVNLFTVLPWDVEYALKQDVRFFNAKAEYKWPNKLNVTVKEREPALYVANSYNGYIMVDYKGTIMSVTNSIPDAKAPLLTGEKKNLPRPAFLQQAVQHPMQTLIVKTQQCVIQNQGNGCFRREYSVADGQPHRQI